MNTKTAFLVVAVVIAAAFANIYLPVKPSYMTTDFNVQAFASEQDFKDYIEEYAGSSGYMPSTILSGEIGTTSMRNAVMDDSVAPEPATFSDSQDAKGTGEESVHGSSSRVSETNVQVTGIDEPDIVKTDGESIFFSSSAYGRYIWNEGKGYYYSGDTKVIGAFPPEELSVSSEITETGELLLHEDTLVVFSDNVIKGYDVEDTASPEELWEIKLNGSMVDARLYNGKIYLVTRNWIDSYYPCPITPLTRNGIAVEISCSSVFHPVTPASADVTYNAIIMDPLTGESEKAVSFVGSAYSTTLYVSENAMYLTYNVEADMLEFFYGFLTDNPGLFKTNVIQKIEKVMGYDISTQSKMTELGIIINEYMSTLSRDQALKLQNELSDKLADYTNDHKRELSGTGIVKIGMDLEVDDTGYVPGTLLNQFSLDEYDGHLRVAVTVGGWILGSRSESANDVYVLDDSMEIVGSVIDLGLTESIYSARFIGDKGYLVTFRQVDPFYVLDLSDPTSPEVKGELKIPGYSSYLHPISDDRILGIGKEGAYVKVSLFDVSSPDNPTEVDKYALDEYWSDVLNTHHAFLLDKKHGIFFMPGSKGGYVFSYANDDLELVKAKSEVSATRALFIDDYLYIIGSDRIVVLDENTWEDVNELGLEYAEATFPEPVMDGFEKIETPSGDGTGTDTSDDE